jgi:predicted Mrr-cat superfamily restriction endonuclease
MNYSKAVFLINKNARMVSGIYEEGHAAELFKTFDATIKVDDLVVVQSDTRHNMTVVKITGVDVRFDMKSPEKVKWVVAKIDQDAYKTLLAQEEAIIDRIKSAEMNREREQLAKDLLKDDLTNLTSMPLAMIGAPSQAPKG